MLILSFVMITKNAGEVVEDCLISVDGWVDEIIVVDDFSTDDTVEICTKYGARVIQRHEYDLGRQKAFALSQAKGAWVLHLDADERVSPGLKTQILEAIKQKEYDGYKIQYLNHFLGNPIRHGGEDYAMVRLFRRDKASVSSSPVHEHVEVAGEIGLLEGPILHFSYRSISQLFSKFTDYAHREAKRKRAAGERVTLRKLFIDPPHLVWARYIESGGYRDGFVRLLLDVAFGYMEFMTYVFLLRKRG